MKGGPSSFPSAVFRDDETPITTEIADLSGTYPSERPRRVVQADDPSAGRLGAYEVLGRLAAGGMAEVFVARRVGTRELVALKLLKRAVEGDPGLEELFRREGAIALRLDHPNVCRTLEFGVAYDRFYLAMELLEGMTLDQLRRRLGLDRRRLPWEHVARIGAHVAAALAHAHAATSAEGEPLCVVHRDVTPQNVFITWDGAAKLLDFGVAHAERDSKPPELVLGKYGYCSPEQARGEPLDARSDVFSLGVCLHEALLGRPLFGRRSAQTSLAAILNDPVPNVCEIDPELPAAFGDALTWALAKNREDRYGSAAELAAALGEIAAGTSGTQDLAGFLRTVVPPGERQITVEELPVPSWMPVEARPSWLPADRR
ncbi:MAG: serine/threonine-protein kinase [Myxococcota bacterium]